jgi:hypothetical protein
MSHFYGKATPGWKSKQKRTLATRLSALIEELIANEPEISREAPPYVQVDCPRENTVYIRHLTKLPNRLIERFTSQADAVYKDVMDLRS